MAIEDEYGKTYVFQQVYDALSNLAEPEFTAMIQVLKDAGFTGFSELCDRARMKCYEIDAEYWKQYKAPWEKNASTKKSTSKPATFSDMVKKQRNKSINKAIDRDWIAQRCIGVKEDYEHLKQEILSIFQDFVDEMEIENGESFMSYFQSYEFIDVDEAVDNMVKTVKRQFGIQ